jgi:hypothetical protein
MIRKLPTEEALAREGMGSGGPSMLAPIEDMMMG